MNDERVDDNTKKIEWKMNNPPENKDEKIARSSEKISLRDEKKEDKENQKDDKTVKPKKSEDAKASKKTRPGRTLEGRVVTITHDLDGQVIYFIREDGGGGEGDDIFLHSSRLQGSIPMHARYPFIPLYR